MSELLLEIGTEEIPSGFIPRALEEMKALLEKEFQTYRLPFKEIRSMGTPRRLVLTATGVTPIQEGRVVEVIGPAKTIAFDKQGQPTKAALGLPRGRELRWKNYKLLKPIKENISVPVRKSKGRKRFACSQRFSLD